MIVRRVKMVGPRSNRRNQTTSQSDNEPNSQLQGGVLPRVQELNDDETPVDSNQPGVVDNADNDDEGGNLSPIVGTPPAGPDPANEPASPSKQDLVARIAELQLSIQEISSRIATQENAVPPPVSDPSDVALGKQPVVPGEGSSAAANQQANPDPGSDPSDDDPSDHSDHSVHSVHSHRADPGRKGSKKEKRRRNSVSETDSSIRLKSVKCPPLEPYYGKNTAEHREFFRSAADSMNLWSKAERKEDHLKVAYMMLSLKGEPRSLWHDHCEVEKITDFSGKFEYFKNFLLDATMDPIMRDLQVYTKWQNASQGSHSVHSFATYLRALEVQLEPLTESLQVKVLYTKLRPTLQNEILKQGALPTTRESLVALADRLEKVTQPKAVVSSSQKPSSSNKNAPSGSNNNSTEGSKGNKKRSRESSSKKDSTRSDNRKTAKGSEIVCFNCDEPGHKSPDCPQPKRKRQTGKNPNKTPVARVAVKDKDKAGKGKATT